MTRMERVDNMEVLLLENRNANELLVDILWALSYDQKEELFEYLLRMYDIDVDEDYEDTCADCELDFCPFDY